MFSYKFWFFVVGIPLLAITGGIAASLKYRSVMNERANAELAAEVAKVQACGEPLTGGELNAYYQTRKDRPDMTAEILAALVPCKSIYPKNDHDHLPIIGSFGKEIPPPPQTWPQLKECEEFLAKLQPTLETFVAVYRRDGTAHYPVDFREGIAAELPLYPLRNGTRRLSLQFHVALHRGRMEQARDCVLAEVAVGHTLDGIPLEDALTEKHSIFLLAIEDIVLAAKHLPLADEDIVTLRGALSGMNFEEDWNLSIISARARAFSQCLNMHSKATYVPTSQTTLRAKDAAMILRVTRELKKAADKSFIAALQNGPQIYDNVDALNEKSYPVTKVFLIGLPNMPYVVACRMAIRDTANLLLACELYRRRHGRWPAALDVLVPEFVAAVPLDPFSTLPYRIAVTKEEFKVYSIGGGGQDDGGKLENRFGYGDPGFALPIAPDSRGTQ